MKVFSASQIREWDAFTIEHEPIASIDLMERASKKLFDWVVSKFQPDQRILIFCGPGNNGGDGLALARMLVEARFQIEVVIVATSTDYSEDFQTNLERLPSEIEVRSFDDALRLEGDVIIDAIFGSGLTRPVEGVFADAVLYINSLQKTVVSVDVPSGVYCDEVNNHPTKVKATYTLTFQTPKLSFLLPGNEQWIGQWEILDIGLMDEYRNNTETEFHYTTWEEIRGLLKSRSKFDHKGTFGHSMLIGGSIGKIGAVELMAGACLRTGTGLLTVHVPFIGYQIIQIACPEAMCIPDQEVDFISKIKIPEKVNAIGIGPGMDTNEITTSALSDLIDQVGFPMVLDADALNIISQNKGMLSRLPKQSVLTPHVVELERIVGSCNGSNERLSKAQKLSIQYGIIVVLKGAHTAICCPNGKVYFNSTGNPGMATGGSGDVLTGVITALLAQGYTSENAAIIGVFLHGYAGDIAAIRNSEVSMTASDILNEIPNFFKKVLERE